MKPVLTTKMADTRYSVDKALSSLVMVSESLVSFNLVITAAADEEPVIIKNYKHTFLGST